MATTEEIQKEFSKYNKRALTQTDIDNANKYGTGIFANQFKKMTGQASGGGGGESFTGTPPTGAIAPGTAQEATPQSQGATASTQPVLLDEYGNQSTQQQLESMTGSQGEFMNMLEEGLKAKQQEVAPYNKRIQKLSAKMGQVDVDKFLKQGLSPDAALQAASDRVATLRSKIQYFSQGKADAEADIENVIGQVTNAYNSRLAALGLRVEDENATRQEAMSLGFSDGSLLTGVMPPNMPKEYIPLWQAYSLAKQQAAASSGSGHGGSGRGRGSSSSGNSALDKFLKAGGTRKQSADGGWEFFDSSGKPISVETAATFVQGITPADLLRGSSTAQDVKTINDEDQQYENPSSSATDADVWYSISRLSDEQKNDTEWVRQQIMNQGKDPAKFGY